MVALGVEHDRAGSAFAIRIMVDIANRALSPAVNDPTTAVQVIDHLGEPLRLIGSAELQEPERQPQRAGRALLSVRRWEDFLALGSGPRYAKYGAASIQIQRRLRSMLEELRDDRVRRRDRAAVERELAGLDASVEASCAGSPDLDLAVNRGPPGDRRAGSVRSASLREAEQSLWRLFARRA